MLTLSQRVEVIKCLENNGTQTSKQVKPETEYILTYTRMYMLGLYKATVGLWISLSG